MSIQVNQLTKIYGQQKALNAISFHLNKGEIVGFLGPNGAGKSTTLKIITGYLNPNSGSATVCGIDVSAKPLAAKRKIGYLPEANPLYYDMYVREYLSFIAGVHEVTHAKLATNDIIALTGLTTESKKKIGQLSKGYKQRVGLAAALIHQPEVLILDEPTSGLDPNQIIEIRNVIKAQGQNKTVLFSSHILQEVEAICDRVIILHKGNIVADQQLHQLKQTTTANTNIVVTIKEEVLDSLFYEFENKYQINAQTWCFATKQPDEDRKKIMEILLKNHLTLISITNESKSNHLEDVFRQLTK